MDGAIGKNLVTFVFKFFHIDSTGITYKYTRKKREYKSYKFFSYILNQCGVYSLVFSLRPIQ